MNKLRLLLVLALPLSAASLAEARPRLLPINDASVIAGQSSSPRDFLRVGSQVFFIARDTTHGTEIWRTDGTTAGTRMVKDVTDVDSQYPFGPWIEGSLGNALVFTASPDGSSARELWRSDGTSSGTWLIGEIPLPEDGETWDGYVVQVVTADTRVFVMVQDHYGEPDDLYVSNGSAGSLQRIGTYQLMFQPLLGVNGKLFFNVEDPVVGTQMWVSDGTAAGTGMVQRGLECPGKSCGVRPYTFFRIGAKVFFITGGGIWKTDGTNAGTALVAELDEPLLLAAGSTGAYFRVGDRVWYSDGMAEGTRDSGAWPLNASARMLDDGRMAMFSNPTYSKTTIWISDGTATTELVTLPFRNESLLEVAGSRIFIGGNDPFRGVGKELLSVDAGTGAVALVKDIDPRFDWSGVPMSGDPGGGDPLGTKIVFAASDVSGRELWISDGTSGGTKLLANIATEAAGGIVSGTVRDASTGDPVGFGRVVLCPSSGPCDESLGTGPGGTYRFLGVIPGTYTIFATTGIHLTQYYDGKTCPCESQAVGTPITVSAGFETAGIDFSLVRAGTLSGKVTRLSGGAPVWTDVLVQSTNSTFSRRASTRSDTGEYKVYGLPSGTYTVQTASYTYGSAIPFLDEMYGGGPCLSGCPAGTPVTVTVGQDTTGIDLAVHSFGTFSGTVRDKANNLPVGATIELYLPGSTGHYSTSFSTSSSTGAFQSPLLRPGTYYVAANAYGYVKTIYADKACPAEPCDFTGATAVTVNVDGTTTGIDFMVSVQQGRLTGQVTDAAGVPVKGVQVSLYGSDGEYAGYSEDTYADGRYIINDIRPGTYFIRAHDEIYPNRICHDTPCDLTGATSINFSERQSKIVNVKLTSRLSTISGRIVDAVTSEPIGYGLTQTVSLARPDGQSPSSPWTTYTNVETDGGYSISVLTREPALYVIATASGYHRRAYPGVTGDCTPWVACPVPPGATALGPGTHTNIDLAMPRFGWISGRITDAVTGEGIRGHVYFRRTTGGDGSAIADDDGYYTWRHADGSYLIWIEPASYHKGQVYPFRTCEAACNPANGSAVSVPDGTHKTGIDFQLTPLSGSISGRVVDDATGAGIAGASVSINGGSYASTQTDAQGYYTLDGLSAGTYYLYANQSAPYFISVYGGQQCHDWSNCNRGGGTAVVVTSSNTTEDVDFRLIKLRVLSLTPASGPPAGGTRIVVTGTNFTQGAVLTVGGKAATIVSRSSTQIVANTPSGALGPAHVTVTLAPNMTVTLAHAFTYTNSTTFVFTDHPLAAGHKLRAVHVLELRQAINNLRAAGSLAPYAFSDATLAGTPVKAVHLLELRTALNQARSALGRPALAYTNAIAAGTRVRATDVMELRAGVN